MRLKFAEGILTVSEAATRRGVSQSAIRSAIKGGRLPAIRAAGHVGVRSADVMACTFRTSHRKGLPPMADEFDDVRHTDPNEDSRRRTRFKQGWRDAIEGQKYGPGAMQRLTWQNLGYRLGKVFGETSPEQIGAMYDWCVRQQAHTG